MRRSPQKLAFGAALLGLAGYGWVVVRVYLSRADPERFSAPDSHFSWVLGPPASALNEAAERHMREGLAGLQEPEVAPEGRFPAFREHLKAAEALLVRSLNAQPAQPSTLAQLAAVRWELDPTLSPASSKRQLETIALAGRMAPHVPRVQRQLGELLLKMGFPDDAIPYLSRAIALDPSLAVPIVPLLRQNRFSAPGILAALPREERVLIALQDPYFEEKRNAEYLDLLEPALGSCTPDLLETFGRACLRASQPGRLAEAMTRLARFEDSRREAERLLQRSKAFSALGDRSAALEDARQARALQPDGPRFLEHFGRLSLMYGQPEEALAAFHQALGLVARGSGDPGWRARLYACIGQGEEKAGRADRAYDAYRRAVELNPQDPTAKRRLEMMEQWARPLPRTSQVR